MIKFLYKNIIFFLVILFLGCKSNYVNKKEKQTSKNNQDVKLFFLDEYIFPENIKFKDTRIGGLSGIDYSNGFYYVVLDDSKTPRFYKVKIKLKNDKIDTIEFKDVIKLQKSKSKFFKNNFLDLESILVSENEFLLSSEGNINENKKPSIFFTDLYGNFLDSLILPDRFNINKYNNLRHNGVFEGLSKGYDNKGYWSSTELPLKSDGEKSKYLVSKSPIRFTFFNKKTLKPTREFVYKLSPLKRKEKGLVNLNGVTDIIEYKKNHFFVIERTYQSGYINNENLVEIYEAVIEKKSTNTLNIDSLKTKRFTPMKKKLVLNFNNFKDKLTNKLIDNIEGITLGPKLSNGNQSLILVVDDNFQKYGKQLNQFILLEIVKDKK